MSRRILFCLLTVFCAGLWISASAQVMINEVLYDTQGTDDPNLLYTELWGPPGTSLAGWSLVGVNGNNATVYRTVALSGTIPADGYFVIGNTAQVPNVDLVLGGGEGAGVDWQNAGSSSGDDCDGIDLKNAAGQMVDHLCYGICATPGNCAGEGGSNAPDPFPSGGVNRAIARIPDHSDTDNNGTDWVVTETLTPGAPNSGVPCDPQSVFLADIRENDNNGMPLLNGDFVIVRGIVNVDNYTLDSLTQSNFFIQDDDAGCNVFRGSVPQGIMEGDCVEVSAWVGFYNGLTELLSSGSGNCVFAVRRLNHNVGDVDPQVITTQSYFEAFEGMVVRINGVTIIDGTWPGEGQWANLTVSDGSGTIVIRIDDDTQVDGTPAPTGPFSVIGILTQFDSSSPYTAGYQITPRYPADILRGSAVETGPQSPAVYDFRLLDVYPNPFNGTAQIRFAVGTAQELHLSIYDVLGREVAAHTLRGLTPGDHTFAWTPAGPSGLYITRLSASSTVQTAKLLYLK